MSRSWIKIVIAIALGCAVFAVAWLSFAFMTLQRLSGFDDVDYVTDWQTEEYEVGRALRLSRRGLLADKPRYYVITARNLNSGNQITLFEGPAAYPDSPPSPIFMGEESNTILYQLGDKAPALSYSVDSLRLKLDGG